MCTGAIVEEKNHLSEISIQEHDFSSFISPDDEMDKAFDESFAQVCFLQFTFEGVLTSYPLILGSLG